MNQLMDSYMKDIASLQRQETRYHNEVFSDIRREEDFLRTYSTLYNLKKDEKLVRAY